MIVHFGTPNPVDPIKHFFVKAYTFFKEYIKLSEHQKKHFLNNGTKVTDFVQPTTSLYTEDKSFESTLTLDDLLEKAA
jgi:hypothetical protein